MTHHIKINSRKSSRSNRNHPKNESNNKDKKNEISSERKNFNKGNKIKIPRNKLVIKKGKRKNKKISDFRKKYKTDSMVSTPTSPVLNESKAFR